MHAVQSMQRWSSTSGRASRTRMAAVGQATRQWRHSLQSSASTPSEEGRAPWSAASGRSDTVKLTRVPAPGTEVTLSRSLLRRMLGRPMPAPKPSARASDEAVDQPSRMAESTSGMPGPSSTTSTSSWPSLTAASRRPPPSAWMTTFISAS